MSGTFNEAEEGEEEMGLNKVVCVRPRAAESVSCSGWEGGGLEQGGAPASRVGDVSNSRRRYGGRTGRTQIKAQLQRTFKVCQILSVTAAQAVISSRARVGQSGR